MRSDKIFFNEKEILTKAQKVTDQHLADYIDARKKGKKMVIRLHPDYQ